MSRRVGWTGAAATLPPGAPPPLSGCVFTTVRLADGRAAHWERHRARLQRSCRVLFGAGLPDALDDEVSRIAMGAATPQRLSVHATTTDDGRVSTQVRVAAVEGRTPAALHLATVRGRTGDWDHKWCDRTQLDQAQDAVGPSRTPLFVDDDGHVLETSRANVLVVDGRTLRVPPPSPQVLPGVTQAVLLERAARDGWDVAQEPLVVGDLVGGVVVACSSIAGVVGVDAVDELALPRDEPLVARLQALLRPAGGRPATTSRPADRSAPPSAGAPTPVASAVVADGVRRGDRFRYEGYELDPATGSLALTYSLDERVFVEQVSLSTGGGRGSSPEVAAAARLVFLLAGISYYKTAAPPVIDLGSTAVTDRERAFLRSYYVDGLAEYAYKNALDLSDLVVEGPSRLPAPVVASGAGSGRPLVPFGGGIDSIVVVEATRRRHPDLALFVASRAGDRFAAIEAAAEVTGLPVLRADRELDGQVLRSRELGFLNGHVPVTGILSSLAVVTALLDGRDAVVMSNEWSASSGTLEVDGRIVNHQWSKSLDFEAGFRAVLAESVSGFEYFSALRPYSELWVARRLAELPQYHLTFRSCNRSFALDPALRLDHWCGQCDKCCFIDLILAPFVDRERLEEVFDGREPLADPSLAHRFRSLLGDPELVKPFECVGDEDECRAAVLLAADRPDRSGTPLLQRLAADVRAEGRAVSSPEGLLRPLGPHFIPDEHAERDLLG